jgi:hypothetical protein
MIRLPALDLPPAVQQTLRGYQQRVDSKPTYPEQVAVAEKLFKTYGSLQTKVVRFSRCANPCPAIGCAQLG